MLIRLVPQRGRRQLNRCRPARLNVGAECYLANSLADTFWLLVDIHHCATGSTLAEVLHVPDIIYDKRLLVSAQSCGLNSLFPYQRL